jgi:hypothetical protein
MGNIKPAGNAKTDWSAIQRLEIERDSSTTPKSSVFGFGRITVKVILFYLII